MDKLTDDEINEAYFKMLKRNGWKPMDTPTGRAWFGGESHVPILDYVPEKAFKNDCSYEDLDFLVVGWRKA
tara:strand:- start:22 stop:234 length:213 start_codon:yes stop_codon:yes gene_type:complete